MGYGLAYRRDEHWPRTTAMLGIIALAITYHGTYNLLVSFPGPLRWTCYALPTAIALGIHLVNVWQRSAQRA